MATTISVVNATEERGNFNDCTSLFRLISYHGFCLNPYCCLKLFLNYRLW